jgi:Mitochondrial carrier protein
MHEKSDNSILTQLLAGGTSAVVAKSITAPLERIRIIQQTSLSQFSVFNLTSQIYRKEGFLSFWRGNLPAVMRIFPTYALRLTLFERFKPIFSNKQSFSSSLSSGCLSSAVTTVITYPLDVLRTQMAVNKNRLSLVKSISQIRQTNGLYKGMSVNLVEAIPYVGISLASYDTLKQRFPESPKLLLAVLTGMTATVICFPLDTVRRYLIVNSDLNFKSAVNQLWAQGKWLRFYRGLPIAVFKSGPTVGVILTLNDYLKQIRK